jgi:hypothetical protein
MVTHHRRVLPPLRAPVPPVPPIPSIRASNNLVLFATSSVEQNALEKLLTCFLKIPKTMRTAGERCPAHRIHITSGGCRFVNDPNKQAARGAGQTSWYR